MADRGDWRNSSIWMDSPERYGLVSRVLHWVMAYLLIWQFTIALTWYAFGSVDLQKTLSGYGPYHRTVGMLTMLLVMVRIGWTAVNRKRRPRHEAGWPGRFARAGHVAIYVLMFLIPTLALMRVYGSGSSRGGTLWGMPLVPSTGREVPWMIALDKKALHGPLAWTLCALIAGHIVMALHHRFVRRDRILARMAGPLRAAGIPTKLPSSSTKELSDVA